MMLPKTNSLLWKMVVGKVLSFGFRPISEAMSILGTGMFIVQPQLNYTVALQVEMNGRNSVSWKHWELSMKKTTATGCIHVNSAEPHHNHPSYPIKNKSEGYSQQCVWFSCHDIATQWHAGDLPESPESPVGIVDPVWRSEHVWKQHCTTMWHLGQYESFGWIGTRGSQKMDRSLFPVNWESK